MRLGREPVKAEAMLPVARPSIRVQRRTAPRVVMLKYVRVVFAAILVISTLYFVYSFVRESNTMDNIKANTMAAKAPHVANASAAPVQPTARGPAAETTRDPLQHYYRFAGACKLPAIDPFDPDLLRKLDPSADPLADCVADLESLRTFMDGVVVKVANYIPHSGVRCTFRPLYQYGDYYLSKGDWLPINLDNGTRTFTDAIETGCFDEKNRRITTDLHLTICPTSKPREDNNPDRSPDVIIILLDSVSRSQMERSLPKTLKFIRDEMQAVSFDYVNKVGLNSRPNANAMLLGKRIYDLHKSPFGPIVQMDQENCNQSMNTEDYVGFRFKNKGYRTLLAEDWAMGVFNYYMCAGFRDAPPAEHYSRPFQLRMESGEYKKMAATVFTPKCQEYHHVLMDYTKQFIETYKNEPKFSITWLSEIAHDDSNGLYRTDDLFEAFFKENYDNLNNSFVFFMGDHGRRYGPLTDTSSGKLEDYNPALQLIVPEALRANDQLMRNLRHNAAQLTTHYDVHATLVEVQRFGTDWDSFTEFGAWPAAAHWARPLLGASLLHRLPEPRNCARLLVPFEYCICDFGRRRADEPRLARRLAQLTVDELNRRLRADANASALCAELRLDERRPMPLQVEDVFGQSVYQVDFQVQPSGGKYYAKLEVEKAADGSLAEAKMISDEFPRKDRYEEQAKCIDNKQLKNYCYCKS